MDSDAETNFLDTKVAQQAGIFLIPLGSNIPICALNGQKLANTSHQTIPLTLIPPGNHRESITFKLLCCSVNTTHRLIGLQVELLVGALSATLLFSVLRLPC